MTQVMITICAPLDIARLHEAEAAIDRLGNPADAAIRERLDALDGDLGIHFMSLHALPSFTPGKAHLVLEFSADGDTDRAIRQIARAMGGELAAVFALAKDWRGAKLEAYLTERIVDAGYNLAQTPGLAHSGSPGMTVGRIRREAALAARIDVILARQPGGMSALDRLGDVRRQLGDESPLLKPGEAQAEFKATPVVSVAIGGAAAFAGVFLWPLFALFAAGVAATILWAIDRDSGAGAWTALLQGLWLGLKFGVPALVIVLVAGAAWTYLKLRQAEETDWISQRAPDPHLMREILARENHCAQNHMMSLTELKGGWLRQFTLRLVFFGIAFAGSRLYKPGRLGPIGTIHFARWVTLPGTRDVVFVSNYGGSWEAYLEDFITLANVGLTGVWSNTVGFPKTNNLVFGGASDGERFKRYARQSMRPTRFWYSAYPDLITDMIRANASIRRGLSGAMTEDDATTWLSAFGSALRPDSTLVTSEIQSLVFGGLGFLNHSALTLWTLPPRVEDACAWLKEVSRYIAYSDGRRLVEGSAPKPIVQVAISSRGLAALGLPSEGLETFPRAFLDDMVHDHRSRILGDSGPNAPEYWWWGREPAHVAVLAYGTGKKALDGLIASLKAAGSVHGVELMRKAPLKTFDPTDNLEPFGFADGGSQPVIRGTYKGLKSGDPLHLVNAGEFILGYPDNRGNLPPGPCLPAIHDPENTLPVLDNGAEFSSASVNNPRDLGRNGSFLVIRQLEQDADGFNAYCRREAERLKDRLGPPYKIDEDFIAAKLVGRWRNGAPLVRSPYSQPKAPPSSDKPRPPENSFQLGLEDSEGMRCPFGAHIRRANPRDSLNPGSEAQIAISNRHRILRVGRKYQPAPGAKPGLMFMCLNGDIERQFEFVQQTWINGNVVSLSCPTTLNREHDPLMGAGEAENTGFTIPSRDGPIKLAPLPRFVTTRGGGYFFLPGKRLLDYLTR